MQKVRLHLIFPLALAIYYFSHISPSVAVHYAIGAGLVGLTFFGLKRASMAFVIFVILIDDFSKELGREAMEASSFVSLYTLSFSGLSLYLLLAVFFCLLHLVVAFHTAFKKSGSGLVITGISPEIKILLLLGAISAIVGLPNLIGAFRIYVSDLGYFVNILLGYLIVRSIASSRDRFEFFFQAVVFALGAKVITVIFDAVFYSRGLGILSIKPGTDSYLVIAVILYASVSLQRRVLSRPISLLGSVGAILATIAYFALTAARGRIITGVLSLVAFLFAVKAKRFAGYAILLPVTGLIAFQFIPESYLLYLRWKLEFFESSTPVGESASVRLLSLQNIIAQQFATVYQFFIGTGFGGHFTSKYFPFTFALDDADFPSQWIEADRFYKPHGSLMFILLKNGMVGFFLLYGTIFWMNFRSLLLLRSVKYAPYNLHRILLVSSSLILPLMLVNFSSKLQVLTGVLIGFNHFGWRFFERYNRGY